MNYLMFFDQIAYVILTHLASNELDKCMKSRLIQILNDVFIDYFFLKTAQCGVGLGMENGNIKNEQLSASSSYFNGNVGPQHGR